MNTTGNDSMKHRLSVIGLLAGTIMTAGCASDRTLPAFDSVAIEARPSSTGVPAARHDTDTVGTGARNGAAAGAVAGAATALWCGPFVFFCMPFTTVTGAVAGGIGGTAIGGLHDYINRMPEEQREQAVAIIAEIGARRHLDVELKQQVVAQIPESHQRSSDQADVLMTVGTEQIEFVQDDADKLSLRMVVTLDARWPWSKFGPRKESRQYRHETARMPVAYLLASDGLGFEKALTECVDEISTMIAWDLALANEGWDTPGVKASNHRSSNRDIGRSTTVSH